nr:hypothetical protein [Tanacetum cinerariifolium]
MAEVMALFASKVLTTIGNFRICSIVVGMIIEMTEKSFNFVVGASLVKQVAKATNDVAADGMLLRFRWRMVVVSGINDGATALVVVSGEK